MKNEDGIESNLLEASWKRVEVSRHPNRLYTLDFVAECFEEFEELRGDRLYGEDPALIAGMGTLRRHPLSNEKTSVFVLGHQKGRNTKQKIHRNFAMAKPEGYRKAMRVLELAERFKKPVVTFIDTPGAFPGVGAEERGQSEAIAQSILKMFEVQVPTVGLVIGEGGSGGALAIGVVDRLLMLENSTYSVISPESCAAILWGTATEAKKAAYALKLAAPEVKKLKICDELIAECDPSDPSLSTIMGERVLEALHRNLMNLKKQKLSTLLQARYEKYRRIDAT